MTELKKIDGTNFVALTDQEMMELEGGAFPIIALIAAHPYVSGTIAGGIAAVGTAVWGAMRK